MGFALVTDHCLFFNSSERRRSGRSVVDKAQDYQSRDRLFDSPVLRDFKCDFKPRSRLL